MKRFFSILFVVSMFCLISCHRDKDDEPEEGTIEYHGQVLKVMEPVKYDSNGDGKIDENDATIEILGTNLNTSCNADGSPLYSGEGSSSGEGIPADGGVVLGEKLCYHDLEKYCKQNGGFYAFETSVNGSRSSIAESNVESSDANHNGIADFIEDIRSTQSILSIASKFADEYKSETENKIEKASEHQISTSFVKETIENAIIQALEEALYESNESIDISSVETIVTTRVATAIVACVKEADLSQYMTSSDITAIAIEMAGKVATSVTNSISSTVSKSVIAQYEAQVASGAVKNVQGICPNGYHIPSDVEWMIFESALGMSATDLTKAGETEITRGADAGVAKKMVDEFGFNYGGYASINGTYAQLGEAGVYWSSTTGKDNKGDYVWVRQIDTSYSGVVRFKMYEKSGLSTRCFKD